MVLHEDRESHHGGVDAGVPFAMVDYYALDSTLPDLSRPTKSEIEKAMQGHVLAEAHLIGTYQKGSTKN